ncbi:CBS domain-containing protein [Haloarcula sp. Atlit-7R]|uniref:CBS domain-containing protein n=1 Tax=Haloarcula TaxID=2237 RepID=UPI000EF1737C|nr:CBS domain-containing protein [Haloarcula sp. Atlit-7R]RLM88432.1 CBS domain-containing protein [Haloarcula sp. Atlit-7R]
MSFPIRVSDVMSRPVATVTPETTAAEAAKQCDEIDIGSVVVVEDNVPTGTVTTADFVRILGNESNPELLAVGEIMSSPVITIQADAPLGEAVGTMTEHGIARLVALEGETIRGIVTTDDIAHAVPQLLQRSELTPAEKSHQYRVHQETAYEQPDWEFECKCVSEQQVAVGDTVEFSKSLTEQDVQTFAEVSGDTNRLHLDADYAVSTRFGRRIVHGTLVGSLISAALARLPGLTIYVSQTLSFLAPVDIGDRVTAVCEIVEDLGRNKYTLTTDVVDQDGTSVIEGQAVVLIDPPTEMDEPEVEAIV